MLRKLALALVAAASLGAMALAPTAASAGWKGGGSDGGWRYYNHHFGIGYIGGGYDRCYVTRRVATPYGYRFRTVNVCAY